MARIDGAKLRVMAANGETRIEVNGVELQLVTGVELKVHPLGVIEATLSLIVGELVVEGDRVLVIKKPAGEG